MTNFVIQLNLLMKLSLNLNLLSTRLNKKFETIRKNWKKLFTIHWLRLGRNRFLNSKNKPICCVKPMRLT
nr:MAG TPA: hypothetical protein [Caudoviricetes sp.]